MKLLRSVSVLLAVNLLLATAPLAAQDKADLAVVHRIRKEAFERSQVMDHMFYLTDVHGPRLSNSPGYDAAARWVVKQSDQWGLANATEEKWGPYGKGWSTSYFSAHLVEPQYAPLIGVPLAWTPGTDGVVSGTPLLAPLSTENDLDRYGEDLDRFFAEHKGKLRGKIILIREPVKIEPIEEPQTRRYDAEELARRARAPEPSEVIAIDYDNPKVPTDPDQRRRFFSQAPRFVIEKVRRQRQELADRLNRFLVEEGVRLVIHPGRVADGGTIFPPRAGSHRADAAVPPPSIALTPEHYNRIARLIEKKVPLRMDVEVKAQFHEESLDTTNVVAEIPGNSKRDELVIIGAHLDSWEPGTGATDNAAGCAVMMEVMRILKTLNLPMDRTIRMVLWGGEEQGLLGSRAYVKQHFADPATMRPHSEHARVSAYYNLDNGTGKVRGVYLQGNDMARPIFQPWLAPFLDTGATTVSIRNTGGTDHLSFDEVGIPGFQFIQDQVEYGTRTHHSNMDVYDRIQPPDLMQAAAVIASFVYHTAVREELMPRKPLPKPWPKEGQSE